MWQTSFEHGINSLPFVCFPRHGNWSTLSITIPCMTFGGAWHTMDMLWEMFQWIPPIYRKPISFQSKALVVCSVTTAMFFYFCLKKLNVFSQHIGKKKQINIWIPQNKSQGIEISNFCVNYFLRYYLMMQHQPIVKRANEVHGWAHRPNQLLSAPYHCCLYKHRREMKGSHPRAADRCPFVDMAKWGYLFHGFSGGMLLRCCVWINSRIPVSKQEVTYNVR